MTEARNNLVRKWSQAESTPLDRAVRAAREAGDIRDFVTASPQEHGIRFASEQLDQIAAAALRQPSVLGYAPDARGQLAAREAVARYYQRRQLAPSPEQVVLTPGTSLAYLLLFRLLAQRGDEILIPKPGYPLFEDLAVMAGVGLRNYHLTHSAAGWHIDPEEVAFQITPRTRAIVVVAPHNPTGHSPDAECMAALATLCRTHGIALIFDEVFCELATNPFHRPAAFDFPLAVTLNGVSKMLSLPQWKLAWALVTGDHDRTAPLLAALERGLDSLLPVTELGQAMLPDLLRAGEEGFFATQRGIITRRRTALAHWMGLPVTSPGAGAYVCGRLPEAADDEQVALSLLRERGILLHPGYLYGLDGHLVGTGVHRDLDHWQERIVSL